MTNFLTTFNSAKVSLLAAGLLITGLFSMEADARMKRLNPTVTFPTTSEKTTTRSFKIHSDRHQFPSDRMTRMPKYAGESSGEYDTLLEEDFSLLTLGSEDAPDPTMYPENYATTGNTVLPDDLFGMPGWFGCGVHHAGGVAALEINLEREATEDDVEMGDAEYVGQIITYHDGGVLLTPYMNLAGKIHVSFRARAVGAPVFFTYYIYCETASMGYMAKTLKPEDGWCDLEFDTIVTTGEDCNFGINSRFYGNGYLLVDDIKIERDRNFIANVQNADAFDFTDDGFTLSWEAVPYAKDYLVTLEGECPSGGDGYERKTNFESDQDQSITWQGEISEFNDGGAYQGEHELLLKNGDWFEFDGEGNLISEFEYSYRIRDSKEAPHAGILYCDLFDGTKWREDVTTTSVNFLDSYEDDWYVLNSKEQDDMMWWLFTYGDNYKKIRFRYVAPDDEAISIGHLSLRVNNPMEFVTVCNDEISESTSYTFTNLDHSKYEYFYTLKARGENGNESSPLAHVHALGIPTPKVLPATEINARGAFTANWEPTPKATEYKLKLFAYDELTKDDDNYVVLSEDFEKTNRLTTDGSFVDLDNYFIAELDDYTDNPGWTGSGTIAGSSQLGCLEGEPMWGMTYELYSPLMDLDHDNGDYRVYVSGTTEQNDYLVIQGDEIDYAIIPATGNTPFEATVELTGGQKGTRLMIYTANNSAFVIDKLEVMQAVEKGSVIYKTLGIEDAYAPETSFRVTGLDTSDQLTFAYSLQALYYYGTQLVKSNESERIHVNLETTSVETPTGIIENITLTGRTFNITVAADSNVEIFNATGMKVAEKSLSAGSTSITVDQPGIYILKVGDRREKYIVK